MTSHSLTLHPACICLFELAPACQPLSFEPDTLHVFIFLALQTACMPLIDPALSVYLMWGCVVQPQVALVAAMTASEAAIPPLPPYIAAEAAEGAAYGALPSPKASVLNAVVNTVTDLNTRFTQVISHCCTIASSSVMAHQSSSCQQHRNHCQGRQKFVMLCHMATVIMCVTLMWHSSHQFKNPKSQSKGMMCAGMRAAKIVDTHRACVCVCACVCA